MKTELCWRIVSCIMPNSKWCVCCIVGLFRPSNNNHTIVPRAVRVFYFIFHCEWMRRDLSTLAPLSPFFLRRVLRLLRTALASVTSKLYWYHDTQYAQRARIYIYVNTLYNITYDVVQKRDVAISLRQFFRICVTKNRKMCWLFLHFFFAWTL